MSRGIEDRNAIIACLPERQLNARPALHDVLHGNLERWSSGAADCTAAIWLADHATGEGCGEKRGLCGEEAIAGENPA